MSRLFNVNTENLIVNEAIASGAPLTLFCWYKLDTAPTNDRPMLYLAEDLITSNNNSFRLGHSATGAVIGITRTTASSTATTSAGATDTTTWHTAAFVEASSTSRSAYFDGGSKVTNTDSRTPAGITALKVGGGAGTTQPFFGYLAHIAVWGTALSDAQITSLAGGASPSSIEVANLLGYWKLTTDGGATEANSVSGGTALTVTGASFSSDNPTVTEGPAITNIGDEAVYNGEAMVITGTGFGASGNVVTICSADNIAHGSAVTQTISSHGVTSITLTAVDLSSFGYFSNLYVFVTYDSASNAAGYVIQREARFRITDDLYDRTAAANWASESNIIYRITDASINGTVLLSGSTETTDGSAIMQTSYYTLTSGGARSVNDHVYITLFQEDATLANTRGCCVKYLPTYE